MIKAILYDKDGTLIDLAGSWVSDISLMIRDYCAGDVCAHQRIAEAIGIDHQHNRAVPFSVLAQSALRDTATVLQEHLATLPAPTPSIDVIFQKLTQISCAPHLPHALPGTVNTIMYFQQQHMLQGIISNDRVSGIFHTIKALDIADAISYVRGSDSGCGHKPAPAMITQCCEEFDLTPAEIMMVGDSPADMETAKGAGCQHIVGIHPNPHDTVLGYYTQHIVQNLHALPALVQQINHRDV